MTTTHVHRCTDCGEPIPLGSEVYLGHGPELRVFHQGCFEQPNVQSVPSQREAG